MIGNSVLVYFVYLVVLQLSLSILSPVHGAAGDLLLGMRVLVVQHLLLLPPRTAAFLPALLFALLLGGGFAPLFTFEYLLGERTAREPSVHLS